jgi:hypothetical protein
MELLVVVVVATVVASVFFGPLARRIGADYRERRSHRRRDK